MQDMAAAAATIVELVRLWGEAGRSAPRSRPVPWRVPRGQRRRSARRSRATRDRSAHRLDDRSERGALLGELVLDARWRLGVASSNDDLLRLEPAQPLRERAGADPGHACSSSVNRRGPSVRSWTISTVHFAPTISARRDRALAAWCTGSIVRVEFGFAMSEAYGSRGADRARFRAQSHGGGLCTQRPPTIVATTSTDASSSGGHATGSRSRARRGRRGSRAAASRGAARPPRARRADRRREQRLLDRQRLLGRQAGRSSIVRRTPARIPASGSSSSTGASEPLATTAPESSSERNA